MIEGNTLTITLPDEQIERLKELRASSDLTLEQQIVAMIDLDYEEWQDAVHVKKMGMSRAGRYARFCLAEGD